MGTNQRFADRDGRRRDRRLHRPEPNGDDGHVGPNGVPHLVAMWYGVIDGKIWFETKARAQKTVNLRRDERITV